MDDEQRKYFADLMGQLEGVASDARAAASTSRETAATVRRLDARVGVVEGQVIALHTYVHGKPPTSLPPPPTRPIAESLTEHDGDIAHLTGRTLAVEAKVDTLTEMQERQTAILEKLDKVAANPMVRRVAYAIGTLIIGYAAAKGLVLK